MKYILAIIAFATSGLTLVAQNNTALNFGNPFDWLQIQSTPFASTGDFTIAYWYKAPPPTCPGISCNNAVMVSSQSQQLEILQAQQLLYLKLGNSLYSTGVTIQPDTWTHIAVTRSGTSTLVYVNGALAHTQVTNSVYPVSGQFYLGRSFNINFSLDLTCDEFEIWDVARSGADIASDYNSSVVGNEAGLVVYLDFNEGVAEGDNTAITSITNVVTSQPIGALVNFSLTGALSNFVASTVNLAARVKVAGEFELCDAIWHDDLGDALLTIDTSGLVRSTYSIGDLNHNQYYLGQDTLGGVVIHVYEDQVGEQHGLIITHDDHQAVWQANPFFTFAASTWDSYDNTITVSLSEAKDSIVYNYTSFDFPAIDALSYVYQNRFHINKTLEQGGYTPLSASGYLWSSTEFGLLHAKCLDLSTGAAANVVKTELHRVRGVREF